MPNDQNKIVKVFISHKHEDKSTALLLCKKIELYGGNRVDCFVSEKIPYGSDWFDRIRKNLVNTDVLILLFTSSDRTWDWPLYEVGLATNLERREDCRIVCIYSPTSKPPDPINYVQAVKGDQKGIEDFLYKFFCTTEVTGCSEPIHLKLCENRTELAEAAEDIAKGFSTVEPWTAYFTYFLWVIVDKIPLDEKKVPTNAVVSEKSTALELLRLAKTPPGQKSWTWGDLLARLDKPENEKWVKELGDRFYWATRGETVKTLEHSFHCLRSSESYRSLLHKVELHSDGSMQIEVIFVKNVKLKGGVVTEGTS